MRIRDFLRLKMLSRWALGALLPGVVLTTAAPSADAGGTLARNLPWSAQYACGARIEGEKCITVLVDHMRRLRLSNPAATVLIGNPAVADATLLDRSTLYITARSVGTTNLIALDPQNREIATYEIFVREADSKRVTVRRGNKISEEFLCAPHCERTLSQRDTREAYDDQAGIVKGDIDFSNSAVSLQQSAGQ